jgi:hypothetical protein
VLPDNFPEMVHSYPTSPKTGLLPNDDRTTGIAKPPLVNRRRKWSGGSVSSILRFCMLFPTKAGCTGQVDAHETMIDS